MGIAKHLIGKPASNAELAKNPLYRNASHASSKTLLGVLALVAAIIALSFVALATGAFDTSTSDTARVLLSRLGIGSASDVGRTEQAVIESIRLPRIALALLVGGALSTAGTLMQAIFRNPMADPGIIGASGGGALGAVIIIFIGLGSVPFLIPTASFIGSMIAFLSVLSIAFVRNQFSVPTLLLSGIAISLFLGAAVSAIILMTDNFTAQREMLFWLAGGLQAARWQDVGILLPVTVCGAGIAFINSRNLNLLLLGDDEAESLGIRAGAFRVRMAIAASLLTGVAVAFSGIIAFVGLIIPHAVRLIVGADHRRVVILSTLSGALFLLAADTVTRVVIAPAELRVGIVTALIGGPVFLAMLIKSKTT